MFVSLLYWSAKQCDWLSLAGQAPFPFPIFLFSGPELLCIVLRQSRNRSELNRSGAPLHCTAAELRQICWDLNWMGPELLCIVLRQSRDRSAQIWIEWVQSYSALYCGRVETDLLRSELNGSEATLHFTAAEDRSAQIWIEWVWSYSALYCRVETDLLRSEFNRSGA